MGREEPSRKETLGASMRVALAVVFWRWRCARGAGIPTLPPRRQFFMQVVAVPCLKQKKLSYILYMLMFMTRTREAEQFQLRMFL